MKIPSLKTIHHTNYETNHLQDSTSNLFKALQKNPLLKGSLLSEMLDTDSSSPTYNKMIPIRLGLGDVRIPHNLPQRAEGYLVVFQDRPASIYQIVPTQSQSTKEEQARMREESKFITLNASEEVIVKIWVF